jgi:hypothetical protein
MKGKDLIWFWIIFSASFIGGLFLFDCEFDGYSDLITYLSIMIGFKIFSLSILFSSPLRKKLWDTKNKSYKTELHRIKDYYRHSIVFKTLSVIVIFVIPKTLNIDLLCNAIHLGKQSVVLPILTGSAYCLYKTCKDLFHIFTFPTNEAIVICKQDRQ